MSYVWEGRRLSDEELEERYVDWIDRVERAAKRKLDIVNLVAWLIATSVVVAGVFFAAYGVLEIAAWVVKKVL